ncbi:MAG: hypothetical protein OER04_02370 [Cyclobacteriaceae bacterium]|nr:hypothetical protein [Cyclobacteriaceae bacterium]
MLINLHNLLRIFLAIIVGELLLVLGTTLVQEIMFHGIGWYESGPVELVLGGLGSFLAAMLSGVAAFSIVRRQTEIPLGVLSLLVILETFWLIQTGKASGPVWFDVIGGTTLVLGLWVGRFLLRSKKLKLYG